MRVAVDLAVVHELGDRQVEHDDQGNDAYNATTKRSQLDMVFGLRKGVKAREHPHCKMDWMDA